MAGSRELGLKLRQFRTDKCLSQLDLADQLGISNKHLSAIERASILPSADLARRLDDVCEGAGWFIAALARAKVSAGHASSVYEITTHVIYPAIVGSLGGGDVSNVSVQTDCHGSDECRLHLSSCHVAVIYERYHGTFANLTSAAVWRRELISRHRSRVSEHLQTALAALSVKGGTYAFAMFEVSALPQIPSESRERTLQVLSCLSILLGPSGEVRVTEDDVLHSARQLPNMARFSASPNELGWASWAGVSLLAPTGSTHLSRSLVDFEVELQTLWCYAEWVCRTGTPADRDHGIKYLRDSRRALAVPQGTEHTFMRSMRQALFATSGIEEIVNHAIDALQ